MLRCRYTHWDQGFQCSFCGSLEQCQYCHTEYQLDTKRIGKYVGCIFTKWGNYGGELTRLDLRWKQHSCQWAGKPWLPDLNHWKEPAKFVAGSIKDAFEDGQPFIFE